MSDILNFGQNKNRNEMFRFIPFGICIFFVALLLYISGLTPIKKGEFADTDCYMHLVRIRDLYDSGCWYNPIVVRANAPYGHSMHWSKPFDVLLLIVAVPMSIFADFESALFWWAVVISPFLLIASFIVIPWATGPILRDKDGPFLAGFVFLVQLSVLTLCQAGRPDHHSLLLFIFMLSIGFTIRMILRPFNAFLCYMTGATSGLAMWTSLESIVPTCIIICALGLLWVLKNGDFLRKSLHYSIALFVFVGLTMIIEKPYYAFTIPEYDRTSIVHLSIFGFIAVFWATIIIFVRYTSLFRQTTYRFLFALAGVAVVAFLTLLCFPKFYYGPYPDLDPRIISICFNKIDERQSLLSMSGSLSIAAQLIGPAIVSFVFLVYIIFCKTDDEKWQAWIFISLSFAIFFLASLYQVQWSVYVQVLLVLPMTEIMVRLRQRGPKTGLRKTLKNNFILLIFCAVPLFIGLFADRVIRREGSGGSLQDISIVQLCKYLNEEGKGQEQIFRILTHIDFGPEILYRTQHEVISTPYHTRNGHGILDTYDIMTADTDEEAFEIIQKRDIDRILLCPKSTETVVYSKPGHESTFYQRLREDTIPNWLRKVELPSDLSSSFILFETVE